MNVGATSILGAATKATETRATRCTGLMDQTRHRFVETVRPYIRRAGLFERYAEQGLL